MWRKGRTRAAVLFAVAAACLGATLARGQATPARPEQVLENPPARSDPAEGEPVVAIRIVNEQGRVLTENPRGLAVAAGKPLDAEALRESLRQLYRTGDYADLRAETTPVSGGVRLDFVVRENFFVNEIRIEGLKEPPSEGTALASLRLNLGDIFRESDLAEALERLRQALRDDGLYNARVTPSLAPHPETHQMDIIIQVEAGPRARAGEIRVVNHTEYPDAQLLSRFKMHPGKEITAARISSGSERIRKFLVKKRHLSARVAVRRGEYDTAKNRVPLELEVSEGPKVRVEIVGAKISSGTLRKLLPIFQEGAVDRDLLEEGRRNLRDRLESEGYFDAEVDYSTSEKAGTTSANGYQPGEQIVTYRVERSDLHHMLGIAIEGNKYFNTELLLSRLQIQPAAYATRGRFSRRLLQRDVDAMRDLYLANGFLQAKVHADALDNYRGKEGDLFVKFKVEEGPQTRVASLKIEGNHAFTDEELLGVVGSTPGQPFSDFNVASDRDNILAMYFNEGFPEARFVSSVEEVGTASEAAEAKGNGSPHAADSTQPAVNLTYRIEEGPRILVRQVLVGGYEHTRRNVIAREVRMRAGEPLRQGDVVETQRRLYNLGIFNRVAIAPQNPEGTDHEKALVVMVEEGKRFTVAYGGGFEVQRLGSATDPTAGDFRVSPRGILEVSKANFTGRADTLALKLRGSTLQGRAVLSYSAPNTFGVPALSFQATAFAEKTRDVNTFSAQRYEGSVQLTQTISQATTLFYRYAFRKVLVTSLNIPAEEVPLFNQPTLVSLFGVTWFRDRRNNPADPSKGNFTNVDLSVAGTSIGSSANFARFFAQSTTYHPFKRRFTFVRSTRFGVLQPYGNTVSLSFPPPTTQPPPVVIPLPERFFAGGGTSVRGFALNQAGPRDAVSGFPVGGQALLVFNQEFRFPMRLPFIGNRLGGAVFYDAGNVYSRVGRINFRTSPPKPVIDSSNQCVANCTNELNYLAHTIGFGFRYATPIGPVRVDLGYLVNRAQFVIPCPTSTGTSPCQQATQLPRFQIFFNLGSTF
jgi:outer membrane protein assembly complex protein YaeT